MNALPFDGSVLIADKSAWERGRNPLVLGEWSAAILGDQILTCAPCKLEILYSARTSQDFAEWHEALSALRDIPITRTVCEAAVTGMGELAAQSDGYHRVSIPDYLIAAAAQEAAVGVLHYDHHYDKLREVFHFESRWIAPAGSIP
ncbi:MAG: PIN domain-containing protein [Actinobacteria bacterium]|nr:PIN domain-containing protein [Actinomycetota bacterium]